MCMAEGWVSLSPGRIALVDVLALGFLCYFLPEAARVVSMGQGPPRRQETTGAGLSTAPLPSSDCLAGDKEQSPRESHSWGKTSLAFLSLAGRAKVCLQPA